MKDMDRDMNATAKALVLYALNNTYVKVWSSRKKDESHLFFADNAHSADWSYTCQRIPITSSKMFKAYQCNVAAQYLCFDYAIEESSHKYHVT